MSLPQTIEAGRTKAQHIADHQRLHQIDVLLPGDNIQAALDQAWASGGRTIRLAKGTHEFTNLTIRENVTLEGDYGTVLRCTGEGTAITCKHSKVGQYATVTLRQLDIVNAGRADVGLFMNKCMAAVDNVRVSGFTRVGVDIDTAISSFYHRLRTMRGAVGLRVSGGTTTTLVFSQCAIDLATDAVIIDAPATDVTFSDATYFQASMRGVVANRVGTLTFLSCYWEDIEREYLIAGETGQVASVVIVNPKMIGGTHRDIQCDLARFDQVRLVTWLGGDCQVPCANVSVRSTAATGRVFYVQPIIVEQAESWANPSRVVEWRDNHRLLAPSIELCGHAAGDWLLWSGYATVPGELVLQNHKTGHIALRCLPDDTVELALRSPNGQRHMLAVADDGTLSTEAVQ